MAPDPALGLLDELVRADAEHSRSLAELEELAQEAAAIRERAGALEAILDGAPAEAERLAGALAEAEAQREERAGALEEARAELAAAEGKRDAERLAEARRFVVRATDALAMAEKHVAAAHEARAAHERAVAAARAEVPQVEERASALAGALRGRPRVAADAGRAPSGGLPAVAAWASGARAALVVARSGVSAERDALIRQANELGSVVLGEALAAASAEAVRRRVAAALGS